MDINFVRTDAVLCPFSSMYCYLDGGLIPEEMLSIRHGCWEGRVKALDCC